MLTIKMYATPILFLLFLLFLKLFIRPQTYCKYCDLYLYQIDM